MSAKIGVMGLGLMGTAIARRLTEMRQPIVVWNRTPAKCEPLRAVGAVVAASPDELIAQADLVITVTATTVEVCEILERAGAKLAGKDLINFVTASPLQVRDLGAIATRHGARFLSGSLQCYPAEIGSDATLIICAGDAALWHERERIIKGLAGEAYMTGADAGIPSVLDSSVTACFSFGAMTACLEAANFAQKERLDLDVFRNFLNFALARLPSSLNELLDALAREEFESDQATLEIYARSQELFVAAYKDAGANGMMIEATARRMKAAVQAGNGGLGFAAIYRH